jgi:predicted site-specific integrase-resolvase
MTTVGYARVSSTGQDLGVQLEKLEAAGCEKVFKEKRSGVDAWARERPDVWFKHSGWEGIRRCKWTEGSYW